MKETTNIFDEHGCLSFPSMQAYIDNTASDHDNRMIESHVESCEFCADSIEGLRKTSGSEARNSILVLKKKLAFKQIPESSGKTRIGNPLLYAAAALVLLLGIKFLMSDRSSGNDFADATPKVMKVEINRPMPSSKAEAVVVSDNANGNVAGQKKLGLPLVSSNENAVPGGLYTFTDEMPQFPGGIKALDETISSEINQKNDELNRRICGHVLVQFVVNESGEVSNPKVLKSPGAKLSEAAIDVISNLPDFTPGKQMGNSVKVLMTLPLKFGRC